jgi:hypothetical protein
VLGKRIIKEKTETRKDSKMGDKEFEHYLNRENGQIPECQKKLLFEIIQQKMNTSTDLLEIFSKLYLKYPKLDYQRVVDNMMTASKQAFEQLDYLMSILIDEINGASEEEDEKNGPDKA